MRSLRRPPEYGSDEWRSLPVDDPERRASVLFAADCWRLLMSSPHASDLLGEWVEWMQRASMREASWAMSAAVDWREESGMPTYAELRQRRSELVWTVPCLASGIAGCRTVRSIDHPPTADDLVCDVCRASVPQRVAA